MTASLRPTCGSSATTGRFFCTAEPVLKPISASIRANQANINEIKKVCCRKGALVQSFVPPSPQLLLTSVLTCPLPGCLKCVDTPSFRDRTVGAANRNSKGRAHTVMDQRDRRR